MIMSCWKFVVNFVSCVHAPVMYLYKLYVYFNLIFLNVKISNTYQNRFTICEWWLLYVSRYSALDHLEQTHYL
jgi:hypothetical protein